MAPQTLHDVPPAAVPDGHPAVIVPDGPTISYGQMRSELWRVGQLISGQLAAGRHPKAPDTLPCVAQAMENCAEFVLAFLATAWAGAANAPLNPGYTEEEMRFYLEDNEVSLLLVNAQGNAAAEAAAKALGIPVGKCVVEADGSLQLTVGGKAPGSAPLPSADAAARALYLHTSGTTSRPKRVPLLHSNICASIGNIEKTYEMTPEDRNLLVMPLFHVHGLLAAMLTPLATGGTIVMHGKFSASKFWQHAVAHKVSWYTAVPTMQQILLMRADQDYPKEAAVQPQLRFIRSCSASLAASVMERLEKTFGAPVLEAYAMTENAHQMTSNPLPKHGAHKPGSVGLPTGIELCILDDQCQPMPQGKVGEVCIKGPSVTPGYINNPKANEEGFAGGWFHTGDQGYLDEDGYLFLTGRIKELINRGGEKISPLEVDAVLLSHPAVAEAVSFSAPDEKYGEEVAAAVVLKPGTEGVSDKDILAHCKDKIAAFKLPKSMYFSDSLPRTATGKIQRRFVAEHFLKKE
eukprot:TRINITY_DN10343_c0_g1_i1.p1 TRINITY_DN10343_c0_g1~~TRINITY_DN10343_c0_g1_i1.p1  ORF type:complete len:545 (+),score=212.04 TRINITY_DN10343_c0_g1_i1:81-1637(+)